jgi:hypothetical protein
MKNAVEHANAIIHNSVWWGYWDYNRKDRILFLEWIINELKKRNIKLERAYNIFNFNKAHYDSPVMSEESPIFKNVIIKK